MNHPPNQRIRLHPLGQMLLTVSQSQPLPYTAQRKSEQASKREAERRSRGIAAKVLSDTASQRG
jgi:hypothetical protein